MSELQTGTVELDGRTCRVWRKGRGPKLGFLAGFGGLPRWIPFLDELATNREVIVPSLPGFPGGVGHRDLDTHLDWVVATRDLLHAAGLDGADLVGSSVGGGLAAEVAALWPQSVRRLALIAPFGLYHPSGRQADPWAQRPDTLPPLLCAHPERFVELRKPPDEPEAAPEWAVEQVRAVEASARIYFPLGDTRLRKRLPRITAPTLLVWGSEDRLLPLAYADLFAERIRAGKEVRVIAGAGHLAELDQPVETAQTILDWLGPQG